MSGRHKVPRGKHRAIGNLPGRHRKPGPNLNALTERTSMLAVTGVVAASTSLGGAMASEGDLGSIFGGNSPAGPQDAGEASAARLQDRADADRLIRLLTPLALACATGMPYPNPIGLPDIAEPSAAAGADPADTDPAGADPAGAVRAGADAAEAT